MARSFFICKNKLSTGPELVLVKKLALENIGKFIKIGTGMLFLLEGKIHIGMLFTLQNQYW